MHWRMDTGSNRASLRHSQGHFSIEPVITVRAAVQPRSCRQQLWPLTNRIADRPQVEHPKQALASDPQRRRRCAVRKDCMQPTGERDEAAE